VLADERILGADDFVERVLGEADHRRRHSFSSLLIGRQVQEIIGRICKKEGISIRELQGGSRRGAIPGIRSNLAWKLVRELGVSLAETGRLLGVTTSAISQIVQRREMRN
jgi:putative transposase